MKKLLIVLFIVTNFVAFAQNPKIVISDKDGWHKIGETRVNFKNENDKILVLGANRFSSIKIKVTDAPINLKSFVIHFENGEKLEMNVGQEFSVPGETKEVTFGGEKNVKRVDFTYQTIGTPGDKKGHVELWGFKTNP